MNARNREMSTTHRPWYRLISMVLATALVTAMLPVPVFAVKKEKAEMGKQDG